MNEREEYEEHLAEEGDDWPPRAQRRPPRSGVDLNELPVWTWAAILLILVVIGGGLWMMTHGGDATDAPAPAGAAADSPQPTQTALPAGVASATIPPARPAAGPTATPTLAPPPPAQIRAGIGVVVAGTGADKLRLRAGPGTDYATLRIVPDGTRFQVLEGPEIRGSYEWWRLQMEDGTIGWAAGDFLQPIAP